MSAFDYTSCLAVMMMPFVKRLEPSCRGFKYVVFLRICRVMIAHNL